MTKVSQAVVAVALVGLLLKVGAVSSQANVEVWAATLPAHLGLAIGLWKAAPPKRKIATT